MKDSKSLEKKIGIKFRNEGLLTEALTHRSYLNENPKWPVPHNERLEFLGDAVLELVVSEDLYRLFPTYAEGELTSHRAALVNYLMLAQVAKEIELGNFLYLSKGEAKDTGRARDVILANALESLIGAIYSDQGYAAAQGFILKFVMPHLSEVQEKELYRDAKSSLQEIAQEKLKVTPSYKVLKEMGPDHAKTFVVGLYFGDKLIAQGQGPSKQEAEVEAAKEGLEKVQ